MSKPNPAETEDMRDEAYRAFRPHAGSLLIEVRPKGGTNAHSATPLLDIDVQFKDPSVGRKYRNKVHRLSSTCGVSCSGRGHGLMNIIGPKATVIGLLGNSVRVKASPASASSPRPAPSFVPIPGTNSFAATPSPHRLLDEAQAMPA